MTVQEMISAALPYLGQTKTQGSECKALYCPFCGGGKNKDRYTFAINLDTGAYNCMRGSCGEKGDAKKLLKHFGIDTDEQVPKSAPKSAHVSQETKPSRKQPLTSKGASYLKFRGITNNTLALYEVGSDEGGNILFPIYETDGKTPAMAKYRPDHTPKDGELKAWRSKGGKAYLFGFNAYRAVPSREVIICEGEIDAMSVYEATGIPALSVPSGCKDFTWLDLCWDWLTEQKSITVCPDMDEPGQEMAAQLNLRLPDNCFVKVASLPEKDANDTLIKRGKDALKSAIEAAKPIVTGLINAADVKHADPTELESVSTGLKGMDKALGGFIMGDLSVWTGRRGEGKTTIATQICAANALNDDKSVCIYSGELQADRLLYWLDLQLAGKENIAVYHSKKYDRDVARVNPLPQEKIRAWYDKRLWIYDNRQVDAGSADSIIERFTVAAKRLGCKVFIVDNLMSVRVETRGDNYYQQQSAFVGRLVDFAIKYAVHVHLIAHPRKQAGQITNDDVAGNADITNRAANVFAIERLSELDKQAKGYDVLLRVTKNRWEGLTPQIGLKYDPVSRRVAIPSEGFGCVYGWKDGGGAQSLIEDMQEDESDLPF